MTTRVRYREDRTKMFHFWYGRSRKPYMAEDNGFFFDV
jgi:hypothetical protein